MRRSRCCGQRGSRRRGRGSRGAPPRRGRRQAELGVPVVVKAQVPAGKRGKAGGIRAADDAAAAGAAAEAVLGMAIGGHRVEAVLVEEQAAIAAEYYAAVLNDPASKGPLAMFSPEGGMDIEEVAAAKPDRVRRAPVDIRRGLDLASARSMLAGFGPEIDEAAVAAALVALYRAYRENDAELLEVNPLARLEDGRLVALDCKFVLDDSGAGRREALVSEGSPEPMTALEARAAALGLKYIELDGDIGVIANGAGLTMTTMDVITHQGGRPANFLEIGGEAYTKAKPALELVLCQSPGEVPRRQLLRRVRADRRHDRWGARCVGGAVAVPPGLLQRARHGGDGGAGDAPRASRGDPIPHHGRGDRGCGRGGPVVRDAGAEGAA